MVATCLVLAVAGVGALWVAQRPAPGAAAVSAGSATEATPGVDDAAALLRDWDARRSAAYAAADVAALRSLYADGSIAGRRDVAVLRSYRARGLRVVGLTTQLLDVRSEHRTQRARSILRVTDRLAGAVAVGRGRRVRLPAGHGPHARGHPGRRGPRLGRRRGASRARPGSLTRWSSPTTRPASAPAQSTT